MQCVLGCWGARARAALGTEVSEMPLVVVVARIPSSPSYSSCAQRLNRASRTGEDNA